MALLWVCLLAACSARSETFPSPQDALPAGKVVAGWRRSEDAKTYDRETLYDHMNGAADLYFTYGFESLREMILPIVSTDGMRSKGNQI